MNDKTAVSGIVFRVWIKEKCRKDVSPYPYFAL